MKPKPGPSPEMLAFMKRKDDIKAGLIPPDEPRPPPQKKPEVCSVSGDRETCVDCRKSCDNSDCDRNGKYRCRRCGIRYLDECRQEAFDSYAKERMSK